MTRIEVALSIILFSLGILMLSSVLFDINCKLNPSAELYRALGNPISSKKFKKNVFFTVILFVASIVLSNNIWGTISPTLLQSEGNLFRTLGTRSLCRIVSSLYPREKEQLGSSCTVSTL